MSQLVETGRVAGDLPSPPATPRTPELCEWPRYWEGPIDGYCGKPATWIVGLAVDEIFAEAYETCDDHLADCAQQVVMVNSDDPNMNGRLELQHLTRLAEWKAQAS